MPDARVRTYPTLSELIAEERDLQRRIRQIHTLMRTFHDYEPEAH